MAIGAAIAAASSPPARLPSIPVALLVAGVRSNDEAAPARGGGGGGLGAVSSALKIAASAATCGEKNESINLCSFFRRVRMIVTQW